MGNQRLKPSLIWKHAEPGGFLHKAGFKGTSVIENVERSFLERPHSGSELGFEGGSLLFFGPYPGRETLAVPLALLWPSPSSAEGEQLNASATGVERSETGHASKALSPAPALKGKNVLFSPLPLAPTLLT